MITFFLKKFQLWQPQKPCEQNETHSRAARTAFSAALEQNLDLFGKTVGSSGDIIVRRFAIESKKTIQAAIVYLDGMIDHQMVHDSILKPLMHGPDYTKEVPAGAGAEYIRAALVSAGDVWGTVFLDEAVEGFLSGSTVLLTEGSGEATVVNLHGWDRRQIDEPKTETVIRGPREGFTETLRTNTAMLRRKIKNPNFLLETMRIGTRTKTNVSIAYIRDLADPDLIKEIRRRLAGIRIDAVLDSGYVEQLIEDAPYSIFSTVANSEKPDKVAAKLLEGRAAILVDGSPFVLTVPMLFVESFQAAEDYYSRYYFASLSRITRFIAFGCSALLPAMYVALTTFHQELIPTPLLLTMAAAREGVPFPAVVEAGIMVLLFGILREAGIRLPRSVGQAVSIVGALVIGQSAVSAGLIGAPMVIIIALTAVADFIIPAQMDACNILRWVFLLLAGFMGGYGIAIGLFAVFIHLASLTSFGTPYLASLAPFRKNDMEDVFVRMPLWSMRRRPQDLKAQDRVRQGGDQKPAPPPEKTTQAQ